MPIIHQDKHQEHIALILCQTEDNIHCDKHKSILEIVGKSLVITIETEVPTVKFLFTTIESRQWKTTEVKELGPAGETETSSRACLKTRDHDLSQANKISSGRWEQRASKEVS